jgi:hypothetical protein
MSRIGAAHAREHRGLARHGQDLAGHVHDDRVGVAVGHHPGQRAAPRHPVAPGVVDDDEVRAAGFRALGRQAGPRAGADDRAALGDLLAQRGERLSARQLASTTSS